MGGPWSKAEPRGSTAPEGVGRGTPDSAVSFT